MSIRQRNRLIYALAAASAGVGVGVLALVLLVPAELSSPASPVTSLPQPGVENREQIDPAPQAISPELLQAASAMDLRKPLFDPPPPLTPAQAGAASAPTPTMASVRLVGTINEPGHSMAMFQKADGTIQVCATGDSIDDAGGKLTVTRIEGLKVTVQWGGQQRQLILDQPRNGGGVP